MEPAIDYGVLSLLPVVIVIIAAALTKRTVEPLLLGTLVGHAILYRSAMLNEFLYGFVDVISQNAWYVLVFGLFGVVIALLEKSGGALGFADFGAKIATTRASSLLITWILGILVFVDDYLNNLAVGTAMRTITDRHRVARELLAWVINSTGAAVCVLVPVSSWAILMISIYEGIGLTVNGSSYVAYLHTIPYMFYAWSSVLLVPFFALRIIPMWGPMKDAELRAANGELFPPNAPNADIGGYANIQKSSLWNFAIPLVALTAVTLYTQDLLLGMSVGVISCLLLYLPQRLATFSSFCDTGITGFKSMMTVTTIVLTAFLLQNVNLEMGLTDYVISVAEPLISARMLPLAVFLLCSLIALFTGSFWGTMTVTAPILIPLAISLGTNPLLVGGAIVSAGVVGSHACFFGDAVTLTAAVTRINNVDYARTSLPIIVLPTAIAAALFAVFGLLQ